MAVLITRPEQQGQELSEMLQKEGIATLHLPLFSIEAGRELNDLPKTLKQLNAGDYVVAVSANAAHYANNTLYHTGFHWRADLHYFAVGRQSAECLSRCSEQNVHYPFQQENSEGLLSLPLMQNITNKRVLLLRGNGGRKLFPNQILQRGATLDIVECYQRIPLQYNTEEQTSILKRSGVNQILVTSLEILYLLLDFIPENEHNWLKNCHLITVSERIAKQASQLGWQQITISPRADNQTLLQTILTLNE